MHTVTSDHLHPDAGFYQTDGPFPLPPVLIRIGARNPSQSRDRRPVFVANLRWLANPRERLAPTDIISKAAAIKAEWKLIRPGCMDHYALAPAFLPVIEGTSSRDRVHPKGAPSIAALLASLGGGDHTAIYVYPVDLATPAVVTASVSPQPIEHDYGAVPPVTMMRGPGDTAYLVVTIVQGRIEPADALSDALLGGGDQIVTEEVAVALLAQFRAMHPDGVVNTIPTHRAADARDHTDALPVLIARATSSRGLAASIRGGISGTSTLQPVQTQGFKGVKLTAYAAAAAAVAYVGLTTVPALYQQGLIPFISKPPPPPPEYVPPALAAAFQMPMPSAWITACFDAFADLYRAVPGYAHGVASCAAHTPDIPGAPKQTPGSGTVPVAATLAPPPAPYGLASIKYIQLGGAKAGQVRDIKAIFQPASAATGQGATAPPAIKIAEPPNMDHFSAYRAMAPASGTKPQFRGIHPLARADDLRRYLLDLKRTACLNIDVKTPIDTQTALLSSPSGPPYAVAPVSRLPITITTNMSPPQFTAFLDSLPGVVMLSVNRSFEDSATLASGGPDKSRTGATQTAEKTSPGSAAPRASVSEAGSDARPSLRQPDFIVCDHPHYASPANWTLEATAYVLQ